MTMSLEELKDACSNLPIGNRWVQFASAIDDAIRERADLGSKWQTERCFRAKAEAELAALKARIDGSRHALLGPNMDRITFLAEDIGPVGKYALVKVENDDA